METGKTIYSITLPPGVTPEMQNASTGKKLMVWLLALLALAALLFWMVVPLIADENDANVEAEPIPVITPVGNG